jgi:hypothetical protein
MSAPLFVLPGLSDEPFTPPGLMDVRATPTFDLEDVVVGQSVMSGMTTSGKIATGVVSRVIRGCGFAFDSPYQNGIIWQQMWLHDDDCPVAARLAAEEAAPKGTLRRTDSGCDYGMFGYPDCAFWERAGVEPLFVATEHHYGPLGDPSAEVRDRRVRDELRRREPTEEEGGGAYRRAWERQSRAVAAVAAVAEEATPASPGRGPFQEPLLIRSRPSSPPLRSPPPVVACDEAAIATPPRLTRAVTPDAPQRRGLEEAPARPALSAESERRVAAALEGLTRLAAMMDAAAAAEQQRCLGEAAAESLPAPSWADKPLERQVAASAAAAAEQRRCLGEAAESSASEGEEEVVDSIELVRRLRFADVLAAPLPMTVGQGCALFVAVLAVLWMYAVCLAHR